MAANAVLNAGLDLSLLSVEGPLSFGLHPWNVDSLTLCENLDTLEKALENSNVVAVGECGLDSLRGPSLEMQKTAFVGQAMIAKEHDRPMILHVVRQIDAIISIWKEVEPSRPWLIHGFRGPVQQMNQLLALGFRLSFGPGADAGSLSAVPDNRLLLETDGKCRIEDVQRLAAGLRGTGISKVRELSAAAAQDFLQSVCHFRK